jgi:hypothetical protein
MSKQSRTYSGIEYSRCKSVHDLIGAIGQAIKENDMEFELMRQTDTEPRDMQDYPIQNVREERQ